MTDYGQQWEAEQARRLQAHIERTTARVGLLRDRYTKLGGMVRGVRVEAPGSGDELPRRTDGAGRSPVNIGALDVVRDVEEFVAVLLPSARGALRLGPARRAGDVTREAWTLGGLAWFASVLGPLWGAEPDLGQEIASRSWALDRRAALILGERARAFPLADVCGACGVPALWASPERMLVRCGNPDCGHEFPVYTPVPIVTK